MSQKKRINIAIDGFSACGKSTLAKALAKKLNYVFIDSGAMYRGVTLFAIENNIIQGDSIDVKKLVTQLTNIVISFGTADNNGNRSLLLNGIDVSEKIRSIAVAQKVSEIAAIKEVRVALVKQQQQIGETGGVIMDGRDIGTVVFPTAELKLFLTADSNIRTQRRFDEMQAKGDATSFEAIAENLAHRDHLDKTRNESPLVQAEDAIVLDNSFLNQEEQLAFVMKLVDELI
ncbi:MAG: (d)CMP kinase [Fluviicola sp.]|nr:(d)CMP kinase [Fluviicola sp.]MBP6272675.1 (d)CMP kinase [Fluviicola sp.]